MHKFKLAFQSVNRYSSYPLHVLIIGFGALLLPFIYSESLFHKTNLPKFSFIALISIFAFLTWLYSIYKNQKSTFYFNKIFALLLVIFVYAAFSILWSDFTGTYHLEISNFACLLLLTFTCMQIKNTHHVQLILFSAVAGGAFSVFYAFFQAWGWNPLNYGMPGGVPAASFINKNHFANYLDLLIPTSFALFIIAKNSLHKWLNSFFISLLFSFILFSHTRASWISLLIVLALILYFAHKYSWLQDKFKETKPSLIIFIILLSLILINSPSTQISDTTRYEKAFSSLAETEIESSTSIRLNAYNNAIKMSKENPVMGTGLGSFHIAFRPYSYNIEDEKHVRPTMFYLHNDPLQIIVELGLIGGSLCFLFVALLLYKTYQQLNTTSLSLTNERIIQIGLLLAIIASISHSFLSFPLHLPAPAFLLFINIGLLSNINSKEIKMNFKIIIFFIFLCATIALFSSLLFLAMIRSSYYLNSSVLSIASYHPIHQYRLYSYPINNDNCLNAKKYTDKAINTYSNDHHTHTQASSIYVICVKNTVAHSKLTNTILNDNPYNRIALESAALIAFNKKDFSLSKKYYSILSYLYPINSGYSLLLGHIEAKQKNYANAHKYYLQTLKLAPNNSAAQDMIEKLLEKGYINNEY